MSDRIYQDPLLAFLLERRKAMAVQRSPSVDEFLQGYQILLDKQTAFLKAFKEASDAADLIAAMRDRMLASLVNPPTQKSSEP